MSLETFQALKAGTIEPGVTRIKISCDLEVFPEELFGFSETLEELDLSGNKLTDLPKNFSAFKNLKRAFFSQNDFSILPGVFQDCPSLTMLGFKSCQIESIADNALPLSMRWLILTDNKISALPQNIGTMCPRLQKVMLAGNQLLELPETMEACKALELIRLSANQFSHFPNILFSLPKLRWLALQGNPCMKKREMKSQLPRYDWCSFSLGEVIGEGASGTIYRGLYQNTSVAMKLFKGSITSDGYAADEMQIATHVGEHKSLISPVALIMNAPNNASCLMYPLLDTDSFKTFGCPPSFETCTRDTFAEDISLSPSIAIRLLEDVASAIDHLHSSQIAHGDIYAHNVMVSEDGQALLGDFGAASDFSGLSAREQSFFIAIEIRAFGCLLEDVSRLVNSEELKRKLKTFSSYCQTMTFVGVDRSSNTLVHYVNKLRV